MRRKILQESTALYQYDVAAPLVVQEAEANATHKNIRTMVYPEPGEGTGKGVMATKETPRF